MWWFGANDDHAAVACVLVHQPLKNFYKKFLYHPFPVESSLHEHIHDHINAEIATGTLKNVSDGVEYLTWTFLFRRLLKNPTYYQIDDVQPTTINTFLKNTVSSIHGQLFMASCSWPVVHDHGLWLCFVG